MKNNSKLEMEILNDFFKKVDELKEAIGYANSIKPISNGEAIIGGQKFSNIDCIEFEDESDDYKIIKIGFRFPKSIAKNIKLEK